MRLSGALSLLSLCLLARMAWAQLPGGSGAERSGQATSLPMSGRTGGAGSVQTTQSASGSGAATINSSVQVSGDFQGSILAGDVPAGPITLTLADAVRRGLAANLGSLTANNSIRAARAQRIQALSALLPSISANASETVTQVNLAAYGLQINSPNFNIPTVVGPYAYSQLQGALSQSVFDVVNRRNWQTSKETERAMTFSAKDARELVIMAVAGTYLQTLAYESRVRSQQAQVENARAVYNQAVVRKSAGTNARIDVMRSLVEFQTQQQRLSSLNSDLRKQKISFARIIGLPFDRDLILSEPLGFNETAVPEAADALRRAGEHRADLKAASSQVTAAEVGLSAARAERLPTVSLNGDYGVIGPNPSTTHGVFAISGAVNMPIWQGGRTKGDIQAAQVTLDQRRAELADERRAVEQEVRNALIELETAIGQVHIATTNRDYAGETLTEARDRFAAGVATTVEVVQAQEQVASAEADYISSLYSFQLARLSLSRSTGEAEANLPDLLKGARQ